MDRSLIANEYLTWLKDNKKVEYGLTNILVNRDGEMVIEKKMAYTIKNTWGNWEEFCKIKGITYEGKIEVLAIRGGGLCEEL